MSTTYQVTEIAQQVLAPLYKLFPSFKDSLVPKFDEVKEDEVCFLLRKQYFRCYRESPNRWTVQSTYAVTKKGKPDKRHIRSSYAFKPAPRHRFILDGRDILYGHLFNFLTQPALFRSWTDAFRACVFHSLQAYISHDDADANLLKELEREKERLIHRAVSPHIDMWYFSVPHDVSETDAALIAQWLNYAGAFPLSFSVLGKQALLDCRNQEEANHLIGNRRILQASSITSIQLFVKGATLPRVDVQPQDRRRADFAKSLLQTHQEILQAGSIRIADTIRLYCRTKEEAIALHDGRWDLAERAQEQQLPQQFELYYFGNDHTPQLFKTFTIQEGLLVKILQRREIAGLFQDFNSEMKGDEHEQS